MPAHLLGSASREPYDETAIGLLLIRLARMKLIGAGVFSDRWGETPDHVERLFLVDAKGARGESRQIEGRRLCDHGRIVPHRFAIQKSPQGRLRAPVSDSDQVVAHAV